MHRTGRGRAILTVIALLAALLALVALPEPADAAPPDGPDKLADFEGPAAPAGFFAFNGGASSVATTPILVGDSDALARPGQVGDNGVLEVVYSVGDFGGFGTSFEAVGPQDWSTTTGFEFWFYGTASGLGYQAEISENRSNPATDTSERFDYLFVDDTAGWKLVSIPWGSFTRATDFQPGGAPDDGFTGDEIWAWAIVLPNGADTVHLDDVALTNIVVDDFESGLASGVDGDGVAIGFSTFQGAGSSIALSNPTTPPAPSRPEASGANSVLQLDMDVTSFAGLIHSFENAAVDTWVPQDWSGSQGFSVWLYGTGSGAQMFFDVLENRNPGSTVDDAERWRVNLFDDFIGWRYFEFPFETLDRMEVGNGAPNDGLELKEVHGWAFGTLGTGGPVTYYIDNVGLFGVAELGELSVGFTAADFPIDEGATGTITVGLNRPLDDSDPDSVSVDYSTETIIPVEDRDFAPVPGGTFTFVKGGPSELSFDIVTIDDAKYEDTERLILRVGNPVDVALGTNLQASASILDNDGFDSLLLDDFERAPDLWNATDDVALTNIEIASGDAYALPGQGSFERVLAAEVPLAVDVVTQGNACKTRGTIPVWLLSTDDFDATAVDHTTVTYAGAEEIHRKNGEARRHVMDVDDDGDMDLVFHFRATDIDRPCDPTDTLLSGSTFDGQPVTGGGSDAGFQRDFAIGQDWSRAESLTFWYHGNGTGDEIEVELLDNRAPDPGPSGWSLAWSDEFNDPAGTPPNPDNWTYELGDGIVNGIPGWGNSELQYYTDDPANAATDGAGNLVITARAADGSLDCYYGPCDYTSARLISWYKAEFAYGKVESRVLVPDGEDGLWPAVWSLGTDIDRVGWPQTGEIDIMEYVSRVPNEIFGTIHGPGYSGGAAYGNIYDFGGPVADNYHTFTIEWEPDSIKWYVDGFLYHTATPGDVAPNEWVFNDPVFLLLNLAIGGNFGGEVSPDLTFPQEMKVDYVRVYQGPDTAERFTTTFTDDFAGWQQVVVPLADLTRSADQPAGAPDDGLTLTDVWGYGLGLPEDGSGTGTILIDQVRLVPLPPPTEIVVTNANDSGSGSLRDALDDIADGGLITFDPALAGGTIALTSGPLVPPRNVTVDAADAPGLAVDGNGADRVLILDAGVAAAVENLTLSGGFGFQLAGCVLNNGDLTLDHVTVTGCFMGTDAGDFWQGGGGVYAGDGATTTIVDSTIADNTSQFAGGGVYAFFNTTTSIVRSTISGNVASDVGGGIRSLGNVDIVNSTLSGNEAIAWHGGAAFITDGVAVMTNVTVTGNTSPGGTAAVFVGTFGPSSATLDVQNSVIAANSGDGCFLAPFGAGAVAINSLGTNVFTDGSCNPVASDQVVADAGLGALADNGGPTLTHALLAGSVAIDAAAAAACPVTDQRGVLRPVGTGCDVGAFELDLG